MSALDLYLDIKNQRFIVCSYALDQQFGFSVFSGGIAKFVVSDFLEQVKEILLEDLRGYKGRAAAGSESYGAIKPFRKMPYATVSLLDDGKVHFSRMRKDSASGGFIGDDESVVIVSVDEVNEAFAGAVTSVFVDTLS